MKIYLKNNVYQESLKRIEFLFNEFENILIGFSGGKDSTVIFNLCLEVARKLNRLPLNVMWIDQEMEWQYTSDFCQKIMERKDVNSFWFQMPIKITNNASSFQEFNYCWAEDNKDNWIREKHELSIKHNKYGTDRFYDLFKAILNVEFNNKKSCYISGVRCEESPSRFMGLTSWATYKWITWGALLDKKMEHYTFYPIYDWDYTDIWKYINDNNIEYNKIYDVFYQKGQHLRNMRVSNLHHETSIHHLKEIHEIEPNTWEKIISRIDGSNTIDKVGFELQKCPVELPFMFKNWKEYAIYLCRNLIQKKENREKILYFLYNDRGIKGEYKISGNALKNDFYRVIINDVLANDWHYKKLTNWEDSPNVSNYRDWRKTNIFTNKCKTNKYIMEVINERKATD